MSFNSICNHTHTTNRTAQSSEFVNRLNWTPLSPITIIPLLLYHYYFIPGLSRPALKPVLFFIYCFYFIRGQFWFIAFRRKGKGKEKLVSLIYSNLFPFITPITAAVTF